MTKITYIPGEIANAAIDEHGNRKPVTRTHHIFDDAKGKSQADINKEFSNAIGGLNSQNYVTVDSFNALPATGEADTVYRVSNWDGTQQDPTVYSEYAWDGSQYVHLSTKTQIGEVFDISAYHATGGTLATYADLSAALDSNNGGGVPQSLQKGGMSVKFVQSSDNKYVQYRLVADDWSINTEDWAIADEGVYVDNPEFVYVKTDAEDKILWAIKADGSIYYGAGVPQQVVDYINERIAELSLDEYEDIVAFLIGLEEDDKTLQDLLNEKVDKEEDKSLIDAEYANGVHYIENQEFAGVWLDNEERILFGVQTDGNFYFGAGVPKQIKDYIESIPAFDPSKLEEQIESIAGNVNGLEEQIEIIVPKINTVEAGNQLNTNTLYLNPENEILPKIENLKRSSKTKSNAVTNSDVLSLLHFSDVHGGNNNILSIKAFYEHYSSYINDVIHTGDVANNYHDGLPSAFSQTPYILHVVGNHEASDRIGTPPNHHWETVSSKTVYDFMFAPNIASWGNIVQPQGATENGYCYYYKDYPSSNIRLIVLDNIPSLGGGPSHWDATQKTWFEGVLADVLDNNSSAYGYHVVVALHYPPFEIDQDFENNPFTAIGHPVSPSLYADVQIPTAVKNFIDAGGKFATYLCGHVHDDMFGFGKQEQGFQNQFVICTCCATPNATQTYTDIQMKTGNRTQDCFNIVGIDTYSKLVKVMRVGANYDLYMRKHDTICINYNQSKIIYV